MTQLVPTPIVRELFADRDFAHDEFEQARLEPTLDLSLRLVELLVRALEHGDMWDGLRSPQRRKVPVKVFPQPPVDCVNGPRQRGQVTLAFTLPGTLLLR